MTAASVTIPQGLESTTEYGEYDVGKQKQEPELPPEDEPTVSVSARIPQHVHDELLLLKRDAKPRVTLSALITDAIELYLTNKKKQGKPTSQ